MLLLDKIRLFVRKGARVVAVWLNTVSGGQLHPNTVTIFGLLMHVPIAWFIATGDNDILAALLLVVFGLFDTLDGELARVQGRASASGMLLDAATDRMKETLLYVGIAFALASSSSPTTAAWAAAACGASLCVSYVKAKGEAAIAAGAGKIDHATLNRLFKDGLLTFELRMTVLVLGLLADQILVATAAIAILAAFTALQRLSRISKALADV